MTANAAKIRALAKRCATEEDSFELCRSVADALGRTPFGYTPRFTSSVEEAATVFPPGWIWDVTSTCTAWGMDESDGCEMINCNSAKKPSLALLSVALNAFADSIEEAEGPLAGGEQGIAEGDDTNIIQENTNG